MPHCPRYQQQQTRTQENIDWTSYCSPLFNNGGVRDQNSFSLKLNSSWPSLGLNNQNLRPNELFENYSTEFLNHRYGDNFKMIKRRTKAQEMCAVNSVSMIDKVSRILFPFVFFILNMAYWTFYINERNSDFIQWEQ
ncbi:hypothetical protein HUG17_1997 [Dermatophagoides farinae]|uniref:Uncharacterized protein n=1 Tax=Dermatophagoides farinae TaxID=6954 RepID=A0A9D4PAH3_DERFA|nr:hypothetical protein HUG17_1997 [Dermatophagoides farinae]